MKFRYFLPLIATLIAQPAMAESINVNIYGMANVDLGYVHPGLGKANTSNVGRMRVGSNASYLGFKGEENINESMKAFWQIESAVFFATGQNQNHLGFATRNTGVGLKNEWGQITLGKWDTPYKLLHNFLEPTYAVGPGYLAAILDTAGQNSGSIDAASSGASSSSTTAVADSLSFSRRQGNSVQYWSPQWKGMQAKLAYSANVDRSATKNPRLFSGSILFDQDGLMAGLAYEQHWDFMSATTTTLPYVGSAPITRDTAWKAMLGYKIPSLGTKVGAAATQLQYKSIDAAGTSSQYKRIAYIASVQHPIDAFTIRGAYGKAGDGTCSIPNSGICNVGRMGAQMAVAALSYTLSPRTDLYAQGVKIWNGSGAYNFANTPIAATITNGSDPLATGLGVRHSF